MNALRFTRGDYSGSTALATVRWRIAEITRPGHPAYDPGKPLPYEITPAWEGGQTALGAASPEFTLPSGPLRVGALYRARVRSEEVIYHLAGGTGTGTEIGSLTVHPEGLAHSPVRSEWAIQVETALPLEIGENSLGVEDKGE